MSAPMVHCTVCPGDVWIPLDTVLDHMELEHRDQMDPKADRYVVVNLDDIEERLDDPRTVEE